MATTSFIYHTLGLVGYDHLRTEYKNGAVYHHLNQLVGGGNGFKEV